MHRSGHHLPSINPSDLLTGHPASVAIVIGADIDDSSTPPTNERNRLVADMVLHYACAPFMRTYASQLSHSSTPAVAPFHFGSQFVGEPLDLSRDVLDMWSKVQPPSDVFVWISDPLPSVGTDTFGDFHDAKYIHYLSVRETLSDVVDECAAETEQAEATEKSQSHLSCQRSTSLPVQQKPSAMRPLRQLRELLPIDLDAHFCSKDTTPFLGMWRSIQATLSGSLTAVRWLLDEPHVDLATTVGESSTPSVLRSNRFAAVHWFGGRHHAQRDAANGFCFVNDVVLAAIALHRGLPPTRNKVLIVDLDAHHGDGTQAAFLYDPDYYTLSVHGYGRGFFPGTGERAEVGKGRGQGYTDNVALPEGATDRLFIPLARQAIRRAAQKMGKALGGIVIVCGSDGIQGDHLGRMNYTIAGMQFVVRLVIETAAAKDAKLLVLGSGGYVDTTAARVAGVVTRDVLSCACVLQTEGSRPDDLFRFSPFLKDKPGVTVPDSCEMFTRYGTSFLMPGMPPAVVERVSMLATTDALFAEYTQLLERQQQQLHSNPATPTHRMKR